MSSPPGTESIIKRDKRKHLRKVMTAETGIQRRIETSPLQEKKKRSQSSRCDRLKPSNPGAAKDENIVNSLKLSLSSVVRLKLWNVPLVQLEVVPRSRISEVSFISPTELETLGLQVPVIIFEIVEYLRENCIKCQGIFRVCGNHDKINESKEALESGSKTIKQVLKEVDIHTAGDLLKGLLGSLPEPIVVNQIFAHLCNAESLRRNPPPIKYGNKRIDQIYMDYVKGALKKLPTVNNHLLFYLLEVFNTIIDHKSVTKMDIRNVATIFSSIVFGMPSMDDSARFLKETDIRSIMLEYFIQFSTTIRECEAPGLQAMLVIKSYKSKKKHQKSLIKGEILFLISSDADFLYCWLGSDLEIYPSSLITHLVVKVGHFDTPLSVEEQSLDSPYVNSARRSPGRRKSYGET